MKLQSIQYSDGTLAYFVKEDSNGVLAKVEVNDVYLGIDNGVPKFVIANDLGEFNTVNSIDGFIKVAAPKAVRPTEADLFAIYKARKAVEVEKLKTKDSKENKT